MAARKGKMIKKMIQSAFHHPLRSLSRNRSPMIWKSTIRYITKKKVQTRSQKKSQKLSIYANLPFESKKGWGASAATHSRACALVHRGVCGSVEVGPCP